MRLKTVTLRNGFSCFARRARYAKEGSKGAGFSSGRRDGANQAPVTDRLGLGVGAAGTAFLVRTA